MSGRARHTVHIRIAGAEDDVAFWLDLLDQLAELHDVSEPEPARHNRVRVYAVVTRRAPLKGYP